MCALTAALLILPQHLTVRVALSLPTLWRRNNRTGTVEDGGARSEELRFVLYLVFIKKKNLLQEEAYVEKRTTH